jgi:RNA polymerase sigma-70 factor (ECF subfamily)
VDGKEKKDTTDPAAALELAYDNHGAELYRYALVILADHAGAEDAVQQAFMKTMKLKNKTAAITSYIGYLRTAVRNECYSIIRKQKRVDNIIESLPARPILQAIDKKDDLKDEHKKLEAAIAALPPEQREILHMKFFENKTFAEIAKITNLSANTAASRYRYAMEKLKDKFNTRREPS